MLVDLLKLAVAGRSSEKSRESVASLLQALFSGHNHLTSEVFPILIDILLLGYCTRFSCTLIKFYSQLAKITVHNLCL